MFRIKICGITNVDDAGVVAAAGVDAVGLNFFPKSRRFVDPHAARHIAAALPAGVTKVGVFVNHTASEIEDAIEQVGLDCVQLHGDEEPKLLGQLPKRVRIVRAHRCGRNGLATLATFLDDCRSVGRLPDAVLVDADAGPAFGGTGQVADWRLIAQQRPVLVGLPLILAGGLTPDNVAAAITMVRPDGVDVASGVESRPGRKDAALVARFIAAARDAFARIGSSDS